MYGIVYDGSISPEMQAEYDRRVKCRKNIKNEIYYKANEITMKPGGIKMSMIGDEFLDKEKSEAYKYCF